MMLCIPDNIISPQHTFVRVALHCMCASVFMYLVWIIPNIFVWNICLRQKWKCNTPGKHQKCFKLDLWYQCWLCFCSVARRGNQPGRIESSGASNPNLRHQRMMMMRGRQPLLIVCLMSSHFWLLRTNTLMTWAMESATTSLSLQPSPLRWELYCSVHINTDMLSCCLVCTN